MTTNMRETKGIWAYIILTYAIMLLTWGVMALLQLPGASAASGTGSSGLGAFLLLLLAGCSPSIAGLVLAWRRG